MTPEEKAVIDAAIEWRERPGEFDALELAMAVRDLIYSCPQCNAGGHTCPRDGNSISHTAIDCGQHEDPRQTGGPDASTFPCWECLTDPTEDPRPWCDCQSEDFGLTTHYGYPCRLRAHTPDRCLNRPDDEPQWVASTLLFCLAGDRIRIGTDETDVLRSSSGAWHANVVSSVLPSGKTWDKVTPWEHTELRLDLSANPGFQEYPPNTPCEILCTPERKAVLLLMTEFPGTREIKL